MIVLRYHAEDAWEATYRITGDVSVTITDNLLSIEWGEKNSLTLPSGVYAFHINYGSNQQEIKQANLQQMYAEITSILLDGSTSIYILIKTGDERRAAHIRAMRGKFKDKLSSSEEFANGKEK